MRLWLVALCMTLTAGLSFLLKPSVDPQADKRANVPLEQLFPSKVGVWQADVTAAAPVRPAFERARQFQMYDQVLERTYVNPQGYRIMLSVAYGRQQSVGLQMHRPEVCYKAGGFKVEAVQAGVLEILGKDMTVARLFASMDGRPEPITYWRLLGDEVVSDETQFKLRQLKFGKRSVPDGMLVRVSSIDPDQQEAFRQHAMFAQALGSSLSPFQRLRVLGER